MAKEKLYFMSHEEFFEKVGEQYLHPTSFGECIWDVSIEELYQHFKSRFIEEQERKDNASDT